MKKVVAIILGILLVSSITGCGSTPSDEKIKMALEDGTITIEDAKEKGWIDDQWIETNFEKIEAKSKIYLFDPFETTYLDGTAVSSDIIEGKMCLVFFDTQEKTTMDKLETLNEVSDQMKEVGVPVLGIIMDEDVSAAKEKLTDMKFPIIVYNKEMQKSLKDYQEVIDKEIVSVFTKDGGFYSAWNSKIEAEELLDSAQRLYNEE